MPHRIHIRSVVILMLRKQRQEDPRGSLASQVRQTGELQRLCLNKKGGWHQRLIYGLYMHVCVHTNTHTHGHSHPQEHTHVHMNTRTHAHRNLG